MYTQYSSNQYKPWGQAFSQQLDTPAWHIKYLGSIPVLVTDPSSLLTQTLGGSSGKSNNWVPATQGRRPGLNSWMSASELVTMGILSVIHFQSCICTLTNSHKQHHLLKQLLKSSRLHNLTYFIKWL